jgi:hypothetical protein
MNLPKLLNHRRAISATPVGMFHWRAGNVGLPSTLAGPTFPNPR